MLISTKGRYALRVMIDLAQNKEVRACRDENRGCPARYFFEVFRKDLAGADKNGLIEGVHGKGGGYRLCREPKEYKVGEILRLTEKPCSGLMPGMQCTCL